MRHSRGSVIKLQAQKLALSVKRRCALALPPLTSQTVRYETVPEFQRFGIVFILPLFFSSSLEWFICYDVDMKDKVAVITGSSQGIGAAIAKLLGEKGYNIVVTYRNNKEKADDVVNYIISKGSKAIAVELDVTSEQGVKACFEIVNSQFGKLDVLVNNAGADGLSPIETTSYEKWREIVGPKIEGNFLCTKYALPLLQKCDKSDIIVIMSSLGDSPDVKDIAYSVGTAGAIGFVKAIARALAKYGVRTNGVGPGAVRTSLGYYEESNLTSDEAWEEIAKSNPLGRVATPGDVAQTVLAVIENPTQFWNGNFIYVTGGDHIPTTDA